MIKDGEAPPPLDQLMLMIRRFYLFIDGNLDNLDRGTAGYLGNMRVGGASRL